MWVHYLSANFCHMDVLITGGAGYIGSHTIIEILSNTDWNPISVDNYHNSSADTYARIEEITGKKIKFYDIDLKDANELKYVFTENDIKGIIHFAAYKAVPESVEKPFEYYDNNVNSLLNVLRYQKEFDVPYFIFSSSCSVYGATTELPVTEKTPIGQTESPYAYTKVVGEHIITDVAAGTPNLQYIALRYFNPVGAHTTGLIGELPYGVPNNLVPFITQTAIGIREQLTIFGDDYDTKDGTCVRDYIHVSDIADAHVLALKYLLEGKNEGNFDVFNLGTGCGVSVMEAVKAFEATSGQNLNYKMGPRRPGDIPKIYANSEKAFNKLGWKAEKTIEEMMASAWKWQQHIGS